MVILEGDCVELMQAMEAGSVDAVVCDPPYGLEFMGKEWDRFRLDDPGTNRNRGDRAGSFAGVLSADENDAFGGRIRGGAGGGKRPTTHRCAGCGKRDQYRNPHEPCGDGDWRLEVIDPHAAPPTMLAFQEWCRTWALEAKRVLKPGGHLLAFGGTRTYHRLACAVEDAGFEIRDTICWLYGSGFPKSLDVGKAIDKQAGHWRGQAGAVVSENGSMGGPNYERTDRGEPVTPEAVRWDGWGTALKPAHEPIVVARKPLAGTVATNVLEHGTGALNVDGCRIGGTPDYGRSAARRDGTTNKGEFFSGENGGIESGELPDYANAAGRWPANVVLDEAAAAMLDEQSGQLPAHGAIGGKESSANGIYGFGGGDSVRRGPTDSGGASRFFYVAKASRAERNAGLAGFEEVAHRRYGEQGQGPLPQQTPRTEQIARNHHPTVKPVQLMRWLVRLVTPPDGLVLDPFAGSGTTGIAASLEGFRFVGCEKDVEYAALARARIGWWAEHGEEALEIVRRQELAEAERDAHTAIGQTSLFDTLK